MNINEIYDTIANTNTIDVYYASGFLLSSIDH